MNFKPLSPFFLLNQKKMLHSILKFPRFFYILYRKNHKTFIILSSKNILKTELSILINPHLVERKVQTSKRTSLSFQKLYLQPQTVKPSSNIWYCLPPFRMKVINEVAVIEMIQQIHQEVNDERRPAKFQKNLIHKQWNIIFCSKKVKSQNWTFSLNNYYKSRNASVPYQTMNLLIFLTSFKNFVLECNHKKRSQILLVDFFFSKIKKKILEIYKNY